MRLEKRNVSISLSPVHVSGHRRVTGGMINDTSHGSEGEVWRMGPYRWGHHRHDHRLVMEGGPPHARPKGLATRRSWRRGQAICVAQFMKQPNPQEKLQELEKVYFYDRTNVITKGGWDKMPGEEQGNYAVARACADGLEVLMKK